MSIVVYSAAGCSDCARVKQWLTDQGVGFEVRDVMEDARYQEEVEQLGFMGIPVTAGAGRAFKGFDPEQLSQLVDAVRTGA